LLIITSFFALALLLGSLPATAQSGSALPGGFYHVANNQIVSDTRAKLLSDMTKIRRAGFNCVRYSWFDAITCPCGSLPIPHPRRDRQCRRRH
jgi:hypothetical protein